MSKTLISAKPDSLKVYFKKIWQHRSLVMTLAKRDLKIKYAQTALGLAWTLLQPLVAVIIYTTFFAGIMNFTTPYPFILFVLSGVMIWGLFNYIFSQGSQSLNQNTDLIKKLAFPKIILPLSKVLLALVEFGIVFFVLLVLMVYFQIPINAKILMLPFFLLPVVFFAFGIALILGALTLKRRDLFHIVPFLVNFGIWLTPVFYPVSIIPPKYLNYLYVNPITCALELCRWALFGDKVNPLIFIGLSLSFLTFIIGFLLFKKSEDKIIDII